MLGERDLLGQAAGVGARLQPDHERAAVAVVGAAGDSAHGDPAGGARAPRARRRTTRSARPRRGRTGLRGPRRARGDDRAHLDRLLPGADRAVLDQAVVAAEGGHVRTERNRSATHGRGRPAERGAPAPTTLSALERRSADLRSAKPLAALRRLARAPRRGGGRRRGRRRAARAERSRHASTGSRPRPRRPTRARGAPRAGGRDLLGRRRAAGPPHARLHDRSPRSRAARASALLARGSRAPRRGDGRGPARARLRARRLRARPPAARRVKSIGRPHLADAVVHHPANAERLRSEGLDERSAFLEAYLIDGKPAFRPRTKPTVTRVDPDHPRRRRGRRLGPSVLGRRRTPTPCSSRSTASAPGASTASSASTPPTPASRPSCSTIAARALGLLTHGLLGLPRARRTGCSRAFARSARTAARRRSGPIAG